MSDISGLPPLDTSRPRPPASGGFGSWLSRLFGRRTLPPLATPAPTPQPKPAPITPRTTPSDTTPTTPTAPATPSTPGKVGKAGKVGGAIALATTLVAGFEGVRNYVYLDIGGVPTVCYGETKGIENRYYPAQECLAMLRVRVVEFNSGLRDCVKVPMRATREAALTSFAYNVGVRAACRSTAVRLLNAGQDAAGCDALMAWNKVAGVPVGGLTRRRSKERALCLANRD